MLGPQLPAIATVLQAVPGVAEVVQPELAEIASAKTAAGELAVVVAVAVGELQRSTFRCQEDIQCSCLRMIQIGVVHMITRGLLCCILKILPRRLCS